MFFMLFLLLIRQIACKNLLGNWKARCTIRKLFTCTDKGLKSLHCKEVLWISKKKTSILVGNGQGTGK